MLGTPRVTSPEGLVFQDSIGIFPSRNGQSLRLLQQTREREGKKTPSLSELSRIDLPTCRYILCVCARVFVFKIIFHPVPTYHGPTFRHSLCCFTKSVPPTSSFRYHRSASLGWWRITFWWVTFQQLHKK